MILQIQSLQREINEQSVVYESLLRISHEMDKKIETAEKQLASQK